MDPNKTIRAIMTTNLKVVRPDSSVTTVKEMFNKYDFRHLPVVDDGNRLVGIISREDYFRLFATLSRNTSGRTWTQNEIQYLKAKNIMTEYPMTLDPDDTIGLAGDIFLANKYHALPIVEDDELLGIVTVHDLLAYAFGDVIEHVPAKDPADNTHLENFETIIS